MSSWTVSREMRGGSGDQGLWRVYDTRGSRVLCTLKLITTPPVLVQCTGNTYPVRLVSKKDV